MSVFASDEEIARAIHAMPLRVRLRLWRRLRELDALDNDDGGAAVREPLRPLPDGPGQATVALPLPEAAEYVPYVELGTSQMAARPRRTWRRRRGLP